LKKPTKNDIGKTAAKQTGIKRMGTTIIGASKDFNMKQPAKKL